MGTADITTCICFTEQSNNADLRRERGRADTSAS